MVPSEEKLEIVKIASPNKGVAYLSGKKGSVSRLFKAIYHYHDDTFSLEMMINGNYCHICECKIFGETDSAVDVFIIAKLYVEKYWEVMP